MPKIQESYKHNFSLILKAAKYGDLCLLDCQDKATGKTARVVCAVQRNETECIMVPLAKLFDGNPYDELNPPNPEGGYIDTEKETKMLELNYTDQGKRPSARQIISDWKKAGRPKEFTCEYGETFARFYYVPERQWIAEGNGCSGIKRDQVEKLLNLDGN